MTTMPWHLYESALEGAEALTARHADGRIHKFEVNRWLADADPVDHRLIERAVGPVLDIGCGPGRHVHALLQSGVSALGLDASPMAVRLASARGAAAVLGDVFTHGLERGVWATVLLLDGNLGIGGDPVALLRRSGEFLTSTGRVLVELEPPGTGLVQVDVRLEMGDVVSDWFPWARVASDQIDELAAEAGLVVAEQWVDAGRHFAEVQWA